eukprot:6171961-Pleurochrysis_carterae.AAC.1
MPPPKPVFFAELTYFSRLLPIRVNLLARQIDADVAQAEPRSHAAAHRTARERVEHGATSRAEPSVHQLSEHRAKDACPLVLHAAKVLVPASPLKSLR